MQLKTMRHHFNQSAWLQKVDKQPVLDRVWRKGNPPTLLVGMYTGAATVETIEGIHTKSWVPNFFKILCQAINVRRQICERTDIHVSLKCYNFFKKVYKSRIYDYSNAFLMLIQMYLFKSAAYMQFIFPLFFLKFWEKLRGKLPQFYNQ